MRLYLALLLIASFFSPLTADSAGGISGYDTSEEDTGEVGEDIIILDEEDTNDDEGVEN